MKAAKTKWNENFANKNEIEVSSDRWHEDEDITIKLKWTQKARDEKFYFYYYEARKKWKTLRKKKVKEKTSRENFTNAKLPLYELVT